MESCFGGCTVRLYGGSSPPFSGILQDIMAIHSSNIKGKKTYKDTVGHYSLRALAQEFHILESQQHKLAVEGYLNTDTIEQLREEYLWRRSEFFLKIAAMCGEDHGEAVHILDDIVMEFSL